MRQLIWGCKQAACLKFFEEFIFEADVKFVKTVEFIVLKNFLLYCDYFNAMSIKFCNFVDKKALQRFEHHKN